MVYSPKVSVDRARDLTGTKGLLGAEKDAGAIAPAISLSRSPEVIDCAEGCLVRLPG